MEKKNMYIAVAIVAVIIVAAVGAVLLTSSKGGNQPQTQIKVLSLSKNSTAPAYSPLDQTAVYNGSYALSRYLYLYTNGVPAPSSSIYKWLDYVLGTDGQKKVVDAGFYELQPSDLQAMKDQLKGGTETNVTGDFKESGSTTLAEVSALWAAQFKEKTGITVTITTQGSGAGIKDFYSGKADVAQASRAMTDAEKKTARDNGLNPVEWKVAVDGIAIIVNKDNPVNSLTVSQLEGMFNGTITNWKDVGGKDQSINLYGRDSTSGSYASFKDMVLKNKDDYSAKMQQFSSNALIIPEVENNAGGIGYVGVGYAKQAGGTASSAAMISYVAATAERLSL